MMTRMCSRCGNNGHNSRTCTEAKGGGGGDGGAGIMLFGVRVMEGSFRKSASMNNLAQYEQPHDSNPDLAAGYASDDVVHASGQNRERKRGVPWTEEEHKLFLLGLKKVGKGDWRGIARNFVKTRTPTQVASHAQKYFLRRNNHNRRRRRSSLFDITTDTFAGSAMEEDRIQREIISQPPPDPNLAVSTYPVVLPVTGEKPEQVKSSSKVIRPTPVIPPSSKMENLNLNHTPNNNSIDPFSLSLKLSSSSSSSSPPSLDQKSPPGRPPSAFQAMSGSFNSSSSGDSNIISVA